MAHGGWLVGGGPEDGPEQRTCEVGSGCGGRSSLAWTVGTQREEKLIYILSVLSLVASPH